MSHADSNHDNTLSHDSTSTLPSKSSQPPIAMAKAGLMDHDSRVHLAKQYRTQWAAAPAAMVSVIAGSPLENIKTRMQSRHFKNSWECIKYTHNTEGIRGFWAGTTTPLISLTLTRVAGFSVYQKAKYAIDAAIEKSTGKSPLKLVNTPGTLPDWSVVTCFTAAGAVSGGALSFLVSPFELIKNATQTSVLMATDTPRGPTISSIQPEKAGRVSSWNACKQIVQRRGILGLYTGFQLHLLRDVIGSGIYFGVYESTKQTMTAYTGAEKPNTMTAIAISGWICGIFSWVVTYPLDTMKTRAQNSLVGPAALARNASASAALATAAARRSTWKGVEMMIARSSLQNMIQMLIFEYVKTQINGLEFGDGSKELPKSEREIRKALERERKRSGV